MSSNGILGFGRNTAKLQARMDQQMSERVNPDRLPHSRTSAAPRFENPGTFDGPGEMPSSGDDGAPAAQVASFEVELGDAQSGAMHEPLGQEPQGGAHEAVITRTDSANVLDEVENDPELKKMAEEYWRQVEESHRETRETQQENKAASRFSSGLSSPLDGQKPMATPTRDGGKYQSQPAMEGAIAPRRKDDAAPQSCSAGENTAPLAADAVCIIEQSERREHSQRVEGHVIACDSNFATILIATGDAGTVSLDILSIGKLITLRTPVSRLIAIVYRVEAVNGAEYKPDDCRLLVEVELMGELMEDARGNSVFSRGISNFPTVGSPAHRIRANDLAAIYHMDDVRQVAIGALSQDNNVPAHVCLDNMISSHFALLGTTGVGKSSAASLLVRKLVEEKPDLRVLILDPHNEFTRAFPDHAQTIDLEAMQLPYWMFQFAEFIEVVYRGNKPHMDEVDALRDLIPLAKSMFAGRSQAATSSLIKRPQANKTLTVDTPVPYSITDLVGLIDEELGRLDVRHERSVLKALKGRLTSLANDPRFAFMFPRVALEDNMAQILGHVFRLPHNGRPITTFELSGIPSAVTNVVVSVLSRLAFDLAVMSKGALEILVLCEEAHRYVPTDPNAGFGPTRNAIARLAKEGRKYGAYLGIISQRPSELDPTILSQCSTIFAMRLANALDQEIIRNAISNSTQNTIRFLSSIGRREAIAFGSGVSVPMRMMFTEIPADQLPDAPSHDSYEIDQDGNRHVDMFAVVKDMRGG